MKRREFLTAAGTAAVTAWLPGRALAAGGQYDRLLVLVELKGGNDGCSPACASSCNT